LSEDLPEDENFEQSSIKNRVNTLRRNCVMLVKQVEVKLKTGLQARPAALFVQEANRFSADIFLEKDGKKVNAKSIMGLMSLAVGSGVMIDIVADGDDEATAIEALADFIQKDH
jgi:catabolite repression HPr-like protein